MNRKTRKVAKENVLSFATDTLNRIMNKGYKVKLSKVGISYKLIRNKS